MFGDHIIYIHLGSNLGKKRKNLQQAIAHIEETVGTICSLSSIYKTSPWGNTKQPFFLNIAVKLWTKLPPFELLYEIHVIEEKMGRVRKERWGERIIDIDILFYNNKVIDYQRLTIPHPLLERRRFVLDPLLEIASDLIHPKSGLSIEKISATCTDTSLVVLLNDK